jgi:orotate phosphoribosyltransferase
VSGLPAVSIQRGHFILESGLHTDAWLDLDSLLLDPAALEPLFLDLTNALRPFDVTAVCGPLVGGAIVAQVVANLLNLRFYFTERVSKQPEGVLTAEYRLPESVRAAAVNERFAVLDDAISAGSATRATVAHLESLGARTAVVGALMLLGDRGERYFQERSIPVVFAHREALSSWQPEECPMCRAGAAAGTKK